MGTPTDAAVAHHQVPLAVGVAVSQVLQERQELLMSVPVLQSPVTFPVAISRTANKVVVPCRR